MMTVSAIEVEPLCQEMEGDNHDFKKTQILPLDRLGSGTGHAEEMLGDFAVTVGRGGIPHVREDLSQS